MVDDVYSYAWPLSRLGEALEALGRETGFSPKPANIGTPRDDDAWIETVATALGIELELVELSYAQIESHLAGIGPAVLRISRGTTPSFLLLLRNRRQASVLRPDLRVHKLAPEMLLAALDHELQLECATEVIKPTQALTPRKVSPAIEHAIVHKRLGAARIGCWLLRLPQGASFYRHLQDSGCFRRLAAFLGAYTLQYGLWILSWWVVGRAALQGRLDGGSMVAWVLLLATMMPFRLLATWLEGRLAIGIGAILKQKLLHGALRIDPDTIRHQGVGQLLGRAIESEAVESLALSGGLLGLVSVIEILTAAVILSAGAGGWMHSVLLLCWLTVGAGINWRYYQQHRRWTQSRLTLTHEQIERMVGHRTRRAQELPEHWHDHEDQALEQYQRFSKGIDTTTTWLLALIPRGWLIVAILGLAPGFVSGAASSSALAVGFGGTILAYVALNRFIIGLERLMRARISWEQIALFLGAPKYSHQEAPSPSPDLAGRKAQTEASDRAPLLEVHDLVFRFSGRCEPVLNGCHLQITRGDRVLLEGPSGEGKSTLASVLAGLRAPQSGLMLLDGMDRQTLSLTGWRQRAAAVPQFHENYVLNGSLAFNLLMGRRWPPRPEDLEEAQAICHELGLGDLIERMPAGLQQTLGEAGWQLSHGERSRLYIARSLLQGADLVILDEGFAALDADTLRQSLQCVLKRSPTLMVIGHP